MSSRRNSPLYQAMKSTRSVFEAGDVATLFKEVSEDRVRKLARRLEEVVGTKLPRAIARRESLADYKTNPYVLMVCGAVMELDDPDDFAKFLVDSKLTMGLETSGGKFVEDAIKGVYPIEATEGRYWEDPREKQDEDRELEGLSDQERAEVRGESSVWQEIDTSCVYGARRYLMSVKSGPNTINDTGKKGIRDAICSNYPLWLEQSQENYGVEGIDVVLGLTYGTPTTTNAKDRQLIAMLLRCGFREEDRDNKPGVLIDETGRVRAYRTPAHQRSQTSRSLKCCSLSPLRYAKCPLARRWRKNYASAFKC